MCFSPQLNPLKTPLNPLNIIRDPKGSLNPKSFFTNKSPVQQLKNPLGTLKDATPGKSLLTGGMGKLG
jgi:hypothetical protein